MTTTLLFIIIHASFNSKNKKHEKHPPLFRRTRKRTKKCNLANKQTRPTQHGAGASYRAHYGRYAWADGLGAKARNFQHHYLIFGLKLKEKINIYIRNG